MHDQHPTMSYVDLNRSGVALMEIVSKPDMRSADEAKAYLTKLRTILRYLGTCDGNMDEGSMRADVNVSVRKPGGEFGTRCEIKNVNSDPLRRPGHRIRGAPADRHPRGRRHDRPGNAAVRPGKGETRSMRSKEEAHDYRYFPDPDLLPLEFDQAFVEAMRGRPARTARRQEGAASSRATACRPTTPSVLVSEKAIGRLFRGGWRTGRDGKAGGQLGDQRSARRR